MSHHLQLTLYEAMNNNLSESVDMRDLLRPKFEVGQTLDHMWSSLIQAGTYAPLGSSWCDIFRFLLVLARCGFLEILRINYANLWSLFEKVYLVGDVYLFLTVPHRFTHFECAVWIAHLTFWTLTLELLDWLVQSINAIFIRKKDVTRERSC